MATGVSSDVLAGLGVCSNFCRSHGSMSRLRCGSRGRKLRLHSHLRHQRISAAAAAAAQRLAARLGVTRRVSAAAQRLMDPAARAVKRLDVS